MRTTLALHIIAGALGILSGFVALFAAKGARLHRASGMLFVYAMLAMSVLGALLAAARSKAPAINIPAALLTFYLVITALTTVRPLAAGARWVNVGGMLLALAVALVDLTFGVEAIAGGGRRHGIPAVPFFMFGAVALLASAGDLRMIRAGGGRRGAARLRRHLWRMCWALWIAAMSFFVGQAKVFPKSVRIPALLALPGLTVLVVMLYWLWRVRARRAARGLVGVHLRDAAVARITP